MDNRNFAEGTNHEEVGQSLEGQSFSYCLVLHCRADVTLGVEYVLDDCVAVTVHGPQGVGHVHEVLVGTVGGEVHIRRAAPIHIA